MSVETDKQGNSDELLRENARLRGDLLTVARRLSHDLLTPVGGIINSNEAMKEVLAETDPNSVGMANSALGSAEELSELIKRASFMLKATAQPVKPQPTAMGGPVFAALERLEGRILRQGATIAQPESWPEIDGVPPWLEVIWWNLIVNALQHAATSHLRIDIGWKRADARHRFWVADNGPGVPGDRQRLLFQPFHLLHEMESVPGLGLSLTQRLVELQGGTCGYTANAGGGACFHFILG